MLASGGISGKARPEFTKTCNPWAPKGPTAEVLQLSVQQIFPQMAAQWRVEAGESVLLAAAAAKVGITVQRQQCLPDLQSSWSFQSMAEPSALRRSSGWSRRVYILAALVAAIDF